MNVLLPDDLDLASTLVKANGQVLALDELMEAHSDYFDTMVALDFVSELLRQGRASIGGGAGAVVVELKEWRGKGS